MSAPVTLEALDLAALIASRVCHDVISPVGAINNGIEVLEDEQDEEMRKIAMDLVKKSAKQASAKLQFARIAFGAAGSAGSEIDSGDAEKVTRGFAESDKVVVQWEGARWLLPKNRVKLLLNLVMIALNAIPRGGVLTVKIEGENAAPVFAIRASGPYAKVSASVGELLKGVPHEGSTIDAHAIQPYYTHLIAKAAGMSIEIGMEEADIVIRAATQAEVAHEAEAA